ncbi:MAG: ATP-binding cassette domain-containing protein, partial [Clostridiales Family XIII bacterium]|nr:ATP-binding cassette domain-containing protein [Clostridiales Family XIII bacterium]
MESYRIEDLTFTYPERGAPALRGICMGIKKGSFTAICGPSGCGKTTLLRHLKPSAAPAGDISGRILFEGAPLQGLSLRDHSAKIGFVTQNPENQTVTDKVWHELAFGLESLGLKTPEIRLRVAEMASFFGIQTWFYRNVSELSGGQKQLLNLASVMAMQPSALILDEPTGQLDPIAASEFISIVGKINHELGVTVVISEHRLEEVLPLADNVAVMDGGAIIAGGAPGEVGAALRGRGHRMFHAMPAPMRIWAAVENGLPCPITVRDGREWLGQMLDGHGAAAAGAAQATTGTTGARASTGAGAQAAPAVELDDVWFRYEKHSPDVIKGISLKAYAGEICAMLGGNGTGKTTALSLISGINKPYRGKALIDGIPVGKLEGRLFDHLLGVLPQNPQTLFVQKTVESDLMEILSDMRHSGGGEGAGSGGRGDGAQAGAGGRGGAAGGADADGAGGMADGAGAGSKRRGDGAQAGVGTGGRGGMADGAASGRGGGGGRGARLTAEEKRRRVAEVAALCRLDALLDSHPYDLSGGEQQRAALAKVLLLQPRILLLDEPTKGLDAEFKQAFARMLRGLAGAGAAIIIVSHD